MPEQVNWLHKAGNLHPACYECINRKRATSEAPVVNPETGKPFYNKGDFAIPCRGIPQDYSKTLPADVWNSLSTKDQEAFLCSQDPVYWGWKYLDWVPRVSKGGIEYQGVLLRCTAKERYLRIGRRCGKTAAMALYALWYAFNHSALSRTGVEAAQMNLVSGDVLVITPYGSQGKRIFKMMRQLLKRASDDIRSSIKRDVSAPFEMELANGSFIISRTSGERSGTQAASSRGEGAGLVVFDEMDRISNESVEAVTAIRTESANVEILGSSTPIGNRETKFYQFCNSPIHAEFYYPSMVMPTWSPQIEMTERLSRDRLSYIREILAEWGDPEAGVFPAEFVDLAQKDQVYRYGTDIGGIGRKPNWIYTMGVDWNHTTGTQIVVCGLDPEKKEVYVVDRAAIDALKWKQHVSVSKVEELNRVWRPKYIYVDWGFGNMQAEALHLRGTRAANQAAAMGIKRAPANLLADAALAEIVKAINSSEGTTIFDQATNEEVKRPTKQVMIQNAMRRFEQGSIHFPETDKPMASQLLSYVEKRVTSSGMPVYASSDSRIGDHIIDALFLALWAYTKEMSVFSGPQSSLFFSYSQPSALWRPSGARDIVEEEGEEIDEEDGCPNYKKASHSRWQMDEKPSPEIRQLMGGLMKSVVSANGSSPYHGARPSHQADNRSHRGLEGPQWHRKRRGNNRDLF